MRNKLVATWALLVLIGCGANEGSQTDNVPILFGMDAGSHSGMDAANEPTSPMDMGHGDNQDAEPDPDADRDSDGIVAFEDCDDSNPNLGAIDLDGDCDGVPTEHDCNDSDASVGVCWQAISVSDSHTCGITAGQTTVCWGDNQYGKATPPERTLFTSISAGVDHTCGVTPGGRILCWGSNESGQLDVPSGVRFKTVATGSFHTCGITTNDRGVCWGANIRSAGENIGGTTEIPRDWTLTDLHARREVTCAIKADDAMIYCWGRHNFRQSGSPLAFRARYRNVRTSGAHTCGLMTDNRPYCWGLNSWEQSTGAADIDQNLKQIDLAGALSCGLTQTGGLVCWGESDSPVRDIPDGYRFDSFVMSSGHACGLTRDKLGVCWGNKPDNQLSRSGSSQRIRIR